MKTLDPLVQHYPLGSVQFECLKIGADSLRDVRQGHRLEQAVSGPPGLRKKSRMRLQWRVEHGSCFVASQHVKTVGRTGPASAPRSSTPRARVQPRHETAVVGQLEQPVSLR